MSFRIDDILKRGNSVPRQDTPKCEKKCPSSPSQTLNHNNFNKNDIWKHFNSTTTCSNSILQQTLQNKPYFSAYLPGYTPNELPSAKFCSSLYNYDMFLPLQSLNSYVDRGCSSLYSRAKYWPIHTPLPSIFPLTYSHYSKRKGGQVRFTTSQTEALEKRFTVHKYLSPEDRRILANSLKLSDRQVKTWFQNRRAKWRRCNSVSSNSSESTKIIFNDDSDNEMAEIDLSKSEDEIPKTDSQEKNAT